MRRLALGLALLGIACGGGSSGPLSPPSPPTQFVKTGGDAQSWYFNNPLPTQLSVTALDASGRGVPGVVVNWAVASGGGGVSPAQSTTDASGVANTTDSIGAAVAQSVTATPVVAGLSPVTFSATAGTPPATASVSIMNLAFNPASVVVRANGTVTWTWNDLPPRTM